MPDTAAHPTHATDTLPLSEPASTPAPFDNNPPEAIEIGALIWSLLLTRYNEIEARAWVALLTEPLRPADPRRAARDKALTTLTNRLHKAVEGGAS